MQHRLAAILAADMVGYSRLMAADELGTIERQRALRSGLIDPKITQFGGRLVKTTGDGLLIEFQSVSAAVECAIEIQKALAERSEDQPDDGRILYRIGINLGDIVIDGDDILGDGVNLASRLEGAAAPGGICVSDSVYQNLKRQLSASFTSLGKKTFKNIPREISVWQWEGIDEVGERGRKSPASPRAFQRKPSIAVLPFSNMSGDPQQEYFSDGITEDIIAELSRFQILSVIARQSAFALKGDQTSIKEVRGKLGVDYIVEGSVRRAGNRARMTAQLVETENGSPIWAERYDRDLEDIFAVQDDVTRSIVAAVAAQLGKDVAEKASRKPTSNIHSYELFLQANRHYYRFTPEENSAAARLYQKAIDSDPGFARSYGGLANTCVTDHFLHWARIDNALQTGLECARKCLELDSNDPLGRAMSAWALIGFQLWEEAEAELDRALARKPGDPDIMAEVGHGLYVIGRPEEGIPLLEEAVRLNPLYPDVYLRWLGIGYYRGERYREAARALSGARLEGWGHGWLAAAYARLGDKPRAQAALAQFVELRSEELGYASASAGSVQDLLGNYQSNFRYEAEWEHFLNGLREAGLPD
jgi:adenylate cyclase